MNLITVEDYKKALRRTWGLFECPKKEDRVFIPEGIWQQIDWTQEEKDRNAALPHKLWNMRHDDNIWPFCHDWRGDDAFGPLAAVGHPKYKQSPPKLIEGRGIARWMTNNDTSILEIPQLSFYENLWTVDNLPEYLGVIERRHSNPRFGEHYEISKLELLDAYAPTPLQKFSDRSYLKLDPFHISWHKMIKRREFLGDKIDIDAEDTVMFFRYGWRHDSYDNYYVKSATYVGLRWN